MPPPRLSRNSETLGLIGFHHIFVSEAYIRRPLTLFVYVEKFVMVMVLVGVKS